MITVALKSTDTQMIVLSNVGASLESSLEPSLEQTSCKCITKCFLFLWRPIFFKQIKQAPTTGLPLTANCNVSNLCLGGRYMRRIKASLLMLLILAINDSY